MKNPMHKGMFAVAGVAVLALGGAVVANAAQDDSTPEPAVITTESNSGTSADDDKGDAGRSHREGEEELTGEDAEKAEAAALKAVPGGTIQRLETDADGAAYEAHMTDADGKSVTVLFDEDFKVTEVVDGYGHGGGHGDKTPDADADQA